MTTVLDRPVAPEQLPMPPASKRTLANRLARAAARSPLYVVLAALALFWLLPAIGLLVASLRTNADNADSGWWNVLREPGQLTLDNYSRLLDNGAITDSFWNTVWITVPATLLVLLLGAMAAYAFAWIPFKGRDPLFLLVVGLLVVPVQVALIPVAKLYGDIGIFGDLIGVVLFHAAFGLPLGIFLLRNFFAGIPAELLEAARMDGASELRIFFRVVLPLGVPALASLAIFQFLWVWNDLLVGLVFAGPSSRPLTVAIQQQTEEFGLNLDVIAPGAFLSMIVPLVVFLAFQRFFVQGLLAGSNR